MGGVKKIVNRTTFSLTTPNDAGMIAPMMTDAELIAAFVASPRGVTRCPSACATTTMGSPAKADREALAKRWAEHEARREARRKAPRVALAA